MGPVRGRGWGAHYLGNFLFGVSVVVSWVSSS